jgi:hypothetical protein
LITAILRLVIFIRHDIVSKDPTWYVTTTLTYTIIEPGVYLIASALLNLRPLKRQFFPENGFTKVIEVTLKKLGIETSINWSLGLSKKSKIGRTVDVQIGAEMEASQESVCTDESATVKLNDVGNLLPEDAHGLSVSSKAGREEV